MARFQHNQRIHVRKNADKRAADEIANRTVCENFDKFEPLFEKVKRELKSGIRHALPVQKMEEIRMAEIQQGEYFIVQGQIAYVAEVGQTFRTNMTAVIAGCVSSTTMEPRATY